MTMGEDLDRAEDAARTARRAAWLAMFALGVALAVLALDNSIKHALIDQANEARAMLDEVKAVANGAKTAGKGRAAAGGGVDAGDDVGKPAPAPAAARNHASGRVGAAGKRAARPAAGPGGNE
jgi:hypothetical protein